MSQLLKQRGFTLQKISPTTFPPDVITTHRRRGDRYSDSELNGILNLVRSGAAYRCRIGRGRYCYGDTPSKAVELALSVARAAKGEGT